MEVKGRQAVGVDATWECPDIDPSACGFPLQVGRRGHCSVEDARAALDLYKLVEGEWEEQLQSTLAEQEALPTFAASNHYMQDEYWPCDVINDNQ